MRQRSKSRSRSPLRECTLSEEEQEALQLEFARYYWLPPEGNDPPWLGTRALRLTRYRLKLLGEIEQLVDARDLDQTGDSLRLLCDPSIFARIRVRWQRFILLDDLARMSDVLFRGPIDSRHADEMDLRLHRAWRILRYQIADLDVFTESTMDFRVSAVKMAMMLETGRPPEAVHFDAQFQLPDARTLSCLLSLRCDKDDPEELMELYRLLCSKLQGMSCSHCHEAFHEGSSCGLFDGEQFTMPVTVPKVFVPPCGHAIHTICLGQQIIPTMDASSSDVRGRCRQCGVRYAWTGIDVDPMVNAFCLMFGPYVDRRAQEMMDEKELSATAIKSIAEICTNFSLELTGLVSASSIWLLLLRRHSFAEPHMVTLIGEEVMKYMTMPEGEDLEVPTLVPALPCEVPSNEFLPGVPGGDSGEDLSPCRSAVSAALDFTESSGEEEPFLDLGTEMLNQIVRGCNEGADRSMHGLLPDPH